MFVREVAHGPAGPTYSGWRADRPVYNQWPGGWGRPMEPPARRAGPLRPGHAVAKHREPMRGGPPTPHHSRTRQNRPPPQPAKNLRDPREPHFTPKDATPASATAPTHPQPGEIASAAPSGRIRPQPRSATFGQQIPRRDAEQLRHSHQFYISDIARASFDLGHDTSPDVPARALRSGGQLFLRQAELVPIMFDGWS